jgi:gamma-glutamylputrescine oxidase
MSVSEKNITSKVDKQNLKVSLRTRLLVAISLLGSLGRKDFRAAGVYAEMRFGNYAFWGKWTRFVRWTFSQMFVVIPSVTLDLIIPRKVSKTPMWLMDRNPLENFPWNQESNAALPKETDTVVIGAGFTGAALAYHWSRRAPSERNMVVIELGDPASGSSGRNEGLVVMGRYFKMVQDSVFKALITLQPDLTSAQQFSLSKQFAHVYCRAAYRNASLIEETIREEDFNCDYVRAGWVQGQDDLNQKALTDSVKLAKETGFTDWVSITPEEVLERTGMHVEHNAGCSLGAASWHPAKWVWCLLTASLAKKNVRLFTRTEVLGVKNLGKNYQISTNRGSLLAKHVVYATESYSPRLCKQLHNVILPMQQQAASGDGGPKTMKPHVGISASWFFAGRYGHKVLFGSGGGRVSDSEAGRNEPSRFITKFVAAEMKKHFGSYHLEMRNEWSGTVGYTLDEYPIVGSIDNKGLFIIAGMAGSGSGVSFNGGRCIVNRILGKTDEPDDYPPSYFAPSRLMNPTHHKWPKPGKQEFGHTENV